MYTISWRKTTGPTRNRIIDGFSRYSLQSALDQVEKWHKIFTDNVYYINEV